MYARMRTRGKEDKLPKRYSRVKIFPDFRKSLQSFAEFSDFGKLKDKMSVCLRFCTRRKVITD